MNPQTLDIQQFHNLRDAGVAGYTVQLTDEEAAHVQQLTTAGRKAWLDANMERLEARKRAAQAARTTDEINRNFGLDSPPPRKSTAIAHHTDPARVATSGGKLDDAPRRPASSPPGPGGYVPGSFKNRRRK